MNKQEEIAITVAHDCLVAIATWGTDNRGDLGRILELSITAEGLTVPLVDSFSDFLPDDPGNCIPAGTSDSELDTAELCLENFREAYLRFTQSALVLRPGDAPDVRLGSERRDLLLQLRRDGRVSAKDDDVVAVEPMVLVQSLNLRLDCRRQVVIAHKENRCVVAVRERHTRQRIREDRTRRGGRGAGGV